jgi:hypothetical protein
MSKKEQSRLSSGLSMVVGLVFAAVGARGQATRLEIASISVVMAMCFIYAFSGWASGGSVKVGRWILVVAVSCLVVAGYAYYYWPPFKYQFSFKYSDGVTEAQKYRIRNDLNGFAEFFENIGLEPPRETPMIVITRSTNNGVGTANAEPYYDELSINFSDIDVGSVATQEYSVWIMRRLVPREALQQGSIAQIAESMQKDAWYRQIFLGIIGRHLSDSYWGKPSFEDKDKSTLPKVLWQIRNRCHDADRLIAYTVRAFADDKNKNYPPTPDDYLLQRIQIADRVAISSEATDMPCVNEIFKEFGISTTH